MHDRTTAAVKPLPSATVILIREGPDNPEVLMVQRHARATFGTSYVFPGGIVDRYDSSAHIHCLHVSAEAANKCLGLEDGGLDYFSAAIREVFEETSVLFARNSSGNWAFSDDTMSTAEIDEIRRRLYLKEEYWSDILVRYELSLACDSLYYCAFWVTPETEARRFTTRFFVAVLPQGQYARHDKKELINSRWMTAADALCAVGTGKMKMIHPTYSTLQDIAEFKFVSEIVDWAQQRSESGIAQLLPRFVKIDGKDRIVMPGDLHYPEDEGL